MSVLLQAIKVLNLCCKASWLCIKFHCGNLSEGALKEFVIDACTRSALLLDFLDDTNSLKIIKKLIETLQNWSIANDMFEKLPAPIPVVKQWVKVALENIYFLVFSRLHFKFTSYLLITITYGIHADRM